MNDFLLEMKYSIVSLLKAPIFFLSIVITLGLTFGALITAFALNHLIFVEPLVYNDHERLVVANQVRVKNKAEKGEGFQSYPALIKWFNNNEVFSEQALIQINPTQLTGIQSQPKVNVSFVTPDYFSIANAPMLQGRAFNQNEGLNNQKPVAVITKKLWLEYFNQADNILGQTISVEDVNYTVIGVLSDKFIQPQVFMWKQESDIFLPWDFNFDSPFIRKNWDSFMPYNLFIGKLKPDISQQRAQLQLTNLIQNDFTEQIQGTDYWAGVSLQARLTSFEHTIIGDSHTTSALFFAGVLALMLIAFSNAINLFLSRTAQKQRKMAIQVALGAKKAHIFREILAESTCLVIAATVLSIFVSLAGITLLQTYASDLLPRLEELRFNFTTLLFVIIISIIFALTFALVAANSINYHRLNTVLQTSGKGAGLQISSRTRMILIASQVTLTIVLLTVNFSLLFEAMATINQPSGINTDDTHYLTLSTGKNKLSSDELQLHARGIKKTLEKQPDIASVAIVSSNPLSPRMSRSVFLPGAPKNHIRTNVLIVDNDYLPLMEHKVLKGRNFSHSQVKDKADVAIISKALADALYPDNSALNKYLLYFDKQLKIIAIIENIYNPSKWISKKMIFLPSYTSQLNFIVKRQPNIELSKSTLAKAIGQFDHNVRIFSYNTMTEILENKLARDIAIAAITVVLSILTLFLAAVGLYGVLSYGIKMRQYELGVRMAIGANPIHIVTQVLSDNAKAIGFGLMLSIIAILFVTTGSFHLGSKPLQLGILPTLIAILITVTLSLLVSLLALNGVANKAPVNSLRLTDS
ncbi:MAG: ABC transporter permease [Alteromonadaceae bacterium]|nr:ABC transporter permease [Alteromonadaceae bacterium]